MAIALDSTSNGTDTNTSLTISHTCAGANRLLVVGILAGSSDVITGVTYNSVAMTRVDISNNGNSTAYMYYLLGPSTGTNNIVISRSPSGLIIADAASFTGVKQSAPEASTTNTASAVASCANTLTTLTDNAIHLATYSTDAFNVDSATNGTLINSRMAYSNPLLITPAGSHTITGNSSGGSNAWATVGAAFAPFAASARILTTRSKFW